VGRLAAVIFDFDGTLADTEWPIYERARVAIEELGGHLTAEQWATHAVGVSHTESYWDVLGPLVGVDVDEATFEAAHEAVTDPPPARDSAPVTDGAVELVHALHDAGVQLAVASGSTRDWLEHHLRRFELIERFVSLVGIDHADVDAGKPAPDLYRAAVAELGVDPSATVAVEDTHRGIASARAAGLAAVVAVPTQLTSHQDLSAADLVTGSLGDLTVEDLAALVG